MEWRFERRRGSSVDRKNTVRHLIQMMAITESEGNSIDDKTDDERENMSNWYNKRKDETSKVLVYNSYIYPTLGMT